MMMASDATDCDDGITMDGADPLICEINNNNGRLTGIMQK